MMPMVQEIFAEAVSGNTWKSSTPRITIRTDIDGSTPIYSQIHSGISKTSTPDSSDITGTNITIDISGTSTDLPDRDLRNPRFGNKRNSTTMLIRESNKLDATVDGEFTKNPVVPHISLSDKLSVSFIQDLYAHCGMHFTTDHVNPVTPKFVDHGLSTTDTIKTGTGIWSPTSRASRSLDVDHWSM